MAMFEQTGSNSTLSADAKVSVTRGELRKKLEVELSKVYGLKATKADVIKIRKIAKRLS